MPKAQSEALRTPQNLPAGTVSWPNDPVQVRRPKGGIGPSDDNEEKEGDKNDDDDDDDDDKDIARQSSEITKQATAVDATPTKQQQGYFMQPPMNTAQIFEVDDDYLFCYNDKMNKNKDIYATSNDHCTNFCRW